MNLGFLINQNKISQINYEKIYKPILFRFGKQFSKDDFKNLIVNNPGIIIHDTISSQLNDLIKLRNPKRNLTKDENYGLVQIHLENTPILEYGVWAYYQWSNRIVHILDEFEYSEVRTNRNIYKISPEEIKILKTKRVGLIGLSVGQSVALTMALERSFGELRITDFDELELTNLNRIRTGVHNLGINKTISVAREISEIDPYLNIKCFSGGLNEENIESFFLDGGKLDLLIDECDGLDMKIICRQWAKKLQLPVLMEASDRGMLDVERYDLEPQRPLLHGLIEHLDIKKIKDLKTNEDKVPYLLPFVGIDTISNRAKASMLEIGETITTWPQLASAVTLGGGITADVARRIFLNQFVDSGRYYVDIEELIGPKFNVDKSKPILPAIHELEDRFLTKERAEEIINKVIGLKFKNTNFQLDSTVVDSLMDSILKAPSAGNNQPWFWFYHLSGLYLFHDKERTKSFLDIQNFISQIGIGTAIENLELSANKLGLKVFIQYFPIKSSTELIAHFSFVPKPNIEVDDLFNFIGKRCTNRNIIKPDEVEEFKLELLKKSIDKIEGTCLNFISQKEDIDKIGKIIAYTERSRLMNFQAHQEFFLKELKWSPERAEKDRTGIDIRTTDLSLSDIAGLNITKNWEVIELLSKWEVGKGLEKLSHKVVKSSYALGLVSIINNDLNNFLLGGRAVQRIWLEATKNNVAMQPLLAPLSFFKLRAFNKKNKIGYPLDEVLLNYENDLRVIFNAPNQSELVFLFRILKADEPKIKSLRMDKDKLFFNSLSPLPQ